MRRARELQSAPLEDEVEATLMGPGYGESIVVHVGDGGWIIVDSCIDDAGKPQALDYLLGMGIDPAEAVDLVVATHWHDDHIRGMNELVDACRKAEFCCAGAFRQREFLAAVHTLDGRGSFAAGTGVGELQRVFTTLVEQGRIPNFVRADVRIRTTRTCEIWSLSPHNSEFVRFLKAVAPLFPNGSSPEGSATEAKNVGRRANHASVQHQAARQQTTFRRVRLRRRMNNEMEWKVTLFEGARHLRDLSVPLPTARRSRRRSAEYLRFYAVINTSPHPLDTDLTDLILTLGRTAGDRATAIVLFVDELQHVPVQQFASLIAALHSSSQEQLPITM